MSVSSHSTQQSNNQSRPDNEHSTGVADSGRWSTKRIAMYALFVALAMAVSLIEFPIIPGVQWLKYDPSGIVCLVAGFAFGPSAAGALLGIVVGAIIALAAAIVGNIIVTPFYAHMTTAQVVALIIPALLPFNALKFTIHGVVTFLVYKPISNLLNH